MSDLPPETFARRRRPLARLWAIRRGACLLLAALVLFAGGCEVSDFLDPSQVVDPKKRNKLAPDGSATPIVQVILDDLDLGVQPPEPAYSDARDVTAADLEVVSEDYIIGPADQLRISIYNFPEPGTQFVDAFTVSDTGLVNLPDIGEVEVAGLTETEASDRIIDTLVEQRIIQPGTGRVNVLAFTRNNRTFTITGTAVRAPGRYPITKPDMTLLDALALAQGVTDAEVIGEYAYVIRRIGDPAYFDNEQAPPRGGNNGEGPVRPGENDPLAPRGAANGNSKPAFAYAQDANGAGTADDFEFEAPQEPTNREVIRVPLQDLLRGALRYNIIVRPDDTIFVPAERGGVYYVGGNAAAVGVYSLIPGNAITLKRAIVSARGFNAVAIPQRTQLIRRYGDQDVFVRVNLAKIFVGQEPDLYVKPDDMIMVGTNFPAPFLAALRNGFRVTYGFGFLYDRNFARERENFQ